jgi:hypothetical protein
MESRWVWSGVQVGLEWGPESIFEGLDHNIGFLLALLQLPNDPCETGYGDAINASASVVVRNLDLVLDIVQGLI